VSQHNATRGLSGTGAAGRGAAIVDVVQRRQANRVAKAAFIVVWAVLTPTIVVVASTITHLLLATVIGLAAGLATAAVTYVIVLVWPAIRLVWYWSGEITTLCLLLAGYLGLSRVLAWPAALLLLAAIIVTPFGFPRSRWWLLRWVWCAITRHRLRTCFATFIRANRYGSLPWILIARPTRAGERVWVWLRPGLSLSDLQTEGGLDRLAVGCWANQVKLSRSSRRNSALVRVDITRRNPLAVPVGSPLAALVPDTATGPTGMAGRVNGSAPRVPLVDPAGLDLPGVPEPVDLVPAGRTSKVSPASRRATTTTTATAAVPAQTPATGGGDDLSEWV
jgi:hypothetical protein